MRAAVACVAVVAGMLTACSGAAEAPEAVRTNAVDLPKSYRFDPPAVEVEAGTTVTWTNNDDFPHNVHLLDGSDRTVDLPLGSSGSLTFDTQGEYDYECSLHPQQMRGTVTVT